MKLGKIKAAFSAAVCAAAFMLPSYNAAGDAKTNTIKIMSIGDSITDGYGTDGSYRKFMYHELTQKGYSIDMVGPQWNWGDSTYEDTASGESFTYDPAHCGYSGYSIQNFPGRNGIYETIKEGGYLEQYSPDIVILQIGTNDVIDNYEIDKASERLEVLIDYILSNISSDSALFVTTIPDLEPNRPDVYDWFANYRHSADWSINYDDDTAEANVQANIKSYNAQVKSLVEKKCSENCQNIYAGDINSVVTDIKTQLKDGVHPNDTGYKLMGNYWAGILDKYLSGSESPTETEPQTETVPETETTTEHDDTPKRGDVNADKKTDLSDIVLLSRQLSKKEPLCENSDVDQNKKVNVFDLVLLKKLVIYEMTTDN